MKLYRNSRGGTSTVELGPALFILLIVILIPCIDMMQIGLAYAFGWYANHIATREAACAGPNPAATNAANGATAAWAATGLGAFVHCPPPVNNVVTDTVSTASSTTVPMVTCVTTVQVRPMFMLPFVASQYVTFQYTGIRPLEEKGLN
jgi:hypothetical protein